MEFGSEYVYVIPSEKRTDEVETLEEEDIEKGLSVLEIERNISDRQRNLRSENYKDGETCVLDILDTAGQEEYSAVRDQYVKDGDGFLFIYSITSRASFDTVQRIIEWAKVVKGSEDIHGIFVANKDDLKSAAVVMRGEGEKLAQKHGIEFIETSAKQNTNIAEAFEMLIRSMPREGVDYKLVILGDGGVGKSSITRRYVVDDFIENYDPTIEDSYRKIVKIKGLEMAKKQTDQKTASALVQGTGTHRKRSFKESFKNLFSKNRKSTRSQLAEIAVGQSAAESNDSSKSSDEEAAAKSIPPTKKMAKKERTCQMIDSNVIVVSFGKLGDKLPVLEIDPQKCCNCEAFMSSVSELSGSECNRCWVCEFCCHENFNLKPEERNVSDEGTVEYMLSPPVEVDIKVKKDDSDDDTLVVYCIDTSTSMSSKRSVPETQARWRIAKGKSERSKYMTSLDCMKTAISKQIKEMTVMKPNRRVGIVHFGSDLHVLGDGRQKVQSLGSEMHYDFDRLFDTGKNIAGSYKPISKSERKIQKKINSLKTDGWTALGPALVLSAGMASQSKGSEIVLCTDGQPNRGLGRLGGTTDGEARNFYSKISYE